MKVDKVNFQDKDDSDILLWLEKLPRYKNTLLKSLWSRVAFFINVLFSSIFKVQKPLFVVLVTNNRCNLSCKYCYGKYGERANYRDYTTKELIEIIDKLWDIGTRNFTVHGGESLLRRDIGQILNYMKLRGFYVSLNTNGILIPQKMDEVKCVDTICISLDGAEEAHDKNRGKGSYKRAMNAIEIVLKNKVPLVAHVTLTRNNINDIESLAQEALKSGFRLQYSILYNTGRLDSNEVLTDQEIRECANKILSLKKKGYPIYYSAGVMNAVIKWPFPIDKKSTITVAEWNNNLSSQYKEYIECYHGVLKYQIDADGRVITCWGHDDYDAPNINDIGIEKAIKQCTERKNCKCCTFMANNEHNLMFSLNLRTIIDLIFLQISDIWKMREKVQ